jgi:hypothetical protein
VEELTREVEDDDARPFDVVGSIFFYIRTNTFDDLLFLFFFVISGKVFFASLEICGKFLHSLLLFVPVLRL